MKLNLKWVKDKPLLVTAPAPQETTAIELVPQGSREIVQVESGNRWGRFPELSLAIAAGLLVIAYGFSEARRGYEWGTILFWVGLLLMYVPVAFRLIGTSATRHERIGLVALLGVGIFLVKILHSPINFTFHDEFVHWRTANDILRTGHLFSENPVIPVSPLYPGLQLVTTALMNEAGITIYGAAAVVIGVARLMLVLALFYFFEQLSGSPRLAGVAALIYMCNPTFMYFSSQYAYESLSLPVAALVLYAAARRNNTVGSERFLLSLTAVGGTLTVVMSHHLTSYALAGFLLLWTAVAFVRNIANKIIEHGHGQPTVKKVFNFSWRHITTDWKTNPHRELENYQPGPGGLALVAVVGAISWLVWVANFTIGYLAPVLRDAVIEVVRLIAGETTGRQLFKGSVGQVAPLWEQLAGYGAVGLIMLALPFGLLHVWRNYRSNALVLTLAVAGLAYPATLGLRLTTAGWEVSNRTSEFVFVPVAVLAAYGLAYIWLSHRPGWEWSGAFVTCLVVMFLGGTLVGWPPFARVPGPYLVAADTRSIELEGIAGAQWARDNLPQGYRMAADRINGLLMLSHGQQRTVMNVGDGINVGTIFMAKDLWQVERDLLTRGKIRWITSDSRLSTSLPMLGIYFEPGEPNSNNHKAPLDLAALRKFDNVPNINRLYDSGDIVIYDAGRVSGVR